MIQLTPQMRLRLAVEPVDFRKGMDGLVQVCRQRLNTDPIAGALFVFANRRRRALKMLLYDGQGFWLAHKRLSRGHFRWWPTSATASTVLAAHQVQRLIVGGDPTAADAAPVWRPLSTR